jgi:hypothetical protein
MAPLLQQVQPQDDAQPAGEIRLRAVVFQSGEWWVGGCLEHAIGSQARTREALIADLERMVRFHIEMAAREGRADPFGRLPKSPKSYWERYNSGNGERLEVVIHAEPADSATIELRAA